MTAAPVVVRVLTMMAPTTVCRMWLEYGVLGQRGALATLLVLFARPGHIKPVLAVAREIAVVLMAAMPQKMDVAIAVLIISVRVVKLVTIVQRIVLAALAAVKMMPTAVQALAA